VLFKTVPLPKEESNALTLTDSCGKTVDGLVRVMTALGVEPPGVLALPELDDPLPLPEAPAPEASPPALEEPLPPLPLFDNPVPEPVPPFEPDDPFPVLDDPLPELDVPLPVPEEPLPEPLEDPVLLPDEPLPVLEEPLPLFDEPLPVLEEPLPLLDDPLPVLEEPPPVLDDPPFEPEDPSPSPVLDDPPPVLEEPLPLVDDPLPVLEEPLPPLDDPPPVLEEPPPVLDDPPFEPEDPSPSPVLDDPPPVLEEPEPLFDDPLPELLELPLEPPVDWEDPPVVVLDGGAPWPSLRVSSTLILESTLIVSVREPALITRAFTFDASNVALTPSTVATIEFPSVLRAMLMALASPVVPVQVRTPPTMLGVTVNISRDSSASIPLNGAAGSCERRRRFLDVRSGVALVEICLDAETRIPRVRFTRAINSPLPEEKRIEEPGTSG
jgi:hypothetical protein